MSTHNKHNDMKKSYILAAGLCIAGLGQSCQTRPVGVLAEGDTVVYHVRDYGLKGDGQTDCLAALNQLLAQVAASNRPTKVLFEPGHTYRIHGLGTDTLQRPLLSRAHGVDIDGQGCTLSIHPAARAWAVYRSQNVVIRNFCIDFSPMPYTQGRVTKALPEEYYLEFEVDPGYPLPIEGDTTYYQGGKMVDCIFAQGHTRKFYQGHSWVKRVEKLAPGNYGVHYALNAQEQLRVGDFFCMKIEHPSAPVPLNADTTQRRAWGEWVFTNFATIEASQTDSLVLEHITTHASPMMTYMLRGCSRHTLRHCTIAGKGGRIVAGNSDGMHLKGNEHAPRIEHCRIERTMDDAIHMKISGDVVQQVLAPNRLRICHADIASDNTHLAQGLEVMVYCPNDKRQLAMCRIEHYEPINYREGIVTLSQPVPQAQPGTMLYLQSLSEAQIEHCTFATQLQRAILTHQPAHVSHCLIQDNGIAFDQALWTGGIEGPPNQTLTVEHCVMKNLAWAAFRIDCPSTHYDQKGCPQLRVYHCVLDLAQGVPALKVNNSWGVSMEHNVFRTTTPRPTLIQLQNTPLVHDEHNLFVSPSKEEKE